jgi:hypothetical protein
MQHTINVYIISIEKTKLKIIKDKKVQIKRDLNILPKDF